MITDQDGNVYNLAGRTVVSLCRCGMRRTSRSATAPTSRQGFQSECKAYELPPPKPKV